MNLKQAIQLVKESTEEVYIVPVTIYGCTSYEIEPVTEPVLFGGTMTWGGLI